MSVSGGDIVVELSLSDTQFKVATKSAGVTLQQLAGKFNQTAASVKRLEDQQFSLTRRLRDTVLILGNLRFVAMDINDVFLKLPMAIMKNAGELERLQIMMTGLSNEMTKAAKAAEGLRSFNFVTDMAKKAPFAINALADTFIKLKTAGIDPTNGSMQALVDATARFGGTGETLKRASVAIQQMAGKGVVSMEELRQQLGEAVPTAMRDMADGMGMSMAKLADTVSKGTLAAGPALDKMLLVMQVRNAGAAKEMMKSWSGLTEQLKTEWALFSKAIADSSFGDAAKEVVRYLMKVMNSDEAKRFADEFGADLAEALNALVSGVKYIVQYREEIILLGKAWLGYKVATSFLQPGLKAARDAIAANIQGMREKNAAMDAAIVRERAAAAEELKLARDQVVAAQAKAADVITAKRLEVATIEQENAKILASHRRLQAGLAGASLGTSRIPIQQGNSGVYNNQTFAQVRSQMQDQGMAMAANQRQAAALKQELKALEATHAAMGGQIAGHTSKITALTSATSGATIAQRAMAAGAGALRAGLALIGGGVGLVTIALMAGIVMWQKWARAAEEAQARKRRAEKKLSTKEDVEATTGELATAEAELARQKGVTPGGFSTTEGGAATGGRTKATVKDFENQQRKVDEAQRKVDELRALKKKQELSLMEADARDIVEGIKAQGQTKIDAIERTRDAEVAALQEKLSKVDDTTKAGAKQRDELTKQQIAADKRAREAVIKEMEASQKKQAEFLANGSGTDSEKFAAELAKQDLDQKLTAARKELTEMNRKETSEIKFMDKEKKGKKGKQERLRTPMDNLLTSMKAANAELDEQIDSFMASGGLADKAAAAAAKIEAQFKPDGNGTGKFVYRDKDGKATDASREQVDEAKRLAAAQVDKQEAMNIAVRIAEQGRDIKGDYTEAMKILADPLGMAKVGDRGKVGAFDDMLAKEGLTPEKIAQKMGTTVEEVKKNKAVIEEMVGRVRRELSTIDAAKSIQDMMVQTEQINVSLILNDRERTRAQLDIETDLYVKRRELELQRMKDAGVDTEILKQYETELAAWKIARAQQVYNETKTPMQRLADTWRDHTKAMEDATAQWAQSGMDAFVEFAKTGKFEFKGLVTEILAGLLKIKMQKELAGLLDGGSSGGGLLGGLLSGFMNSGSTGGYSAANQAGLDKLMGSLQAVPFAKGGIMTSLGSMPLKKYAMGGIAKSPQLALFGEGAHNEAYVPLPDGRTIPVTMSGEGGSAGAMPSVTVNVINQSGQQVDAQQSQPRFDGKQMVLDVVLSAMSQPGSFRDGMKGAIRA